MTYEPIASARFSIETKESGEQIRVKARRQIFPMLFLPVWLAGWTAGGVTAMGQVIHHFEPFLVLWLCGWAVGWVMVAGTLTWMFTGSETLRVVGSDLEVAQHALGWSRRWLYEGGRIRNLRVADQPAWPYRFQFQVPFLNLARTGSVKFDYGPRTIYAAPGLDDAEGRMIVENLLKRLPLASR
ncbi:MAG: hypothetical protein JWP35_4762 [Caulobacter sp.]|nr:hypothetical protein [Caulobacter sp.]